MDAQQFREFGKATIDFIVDYLENTRDFDVLPSVQSGYLQQLIPNEMPEKSEHWKTIFEDVSRVIMPGISHWQSPYFNAYYPTTTSYPSIIGEMLSAGLGLMSFSWISSPACTELEVIVMDWLAKFLNLPKHFLNTNDGPGGGAMQGSASEAILITILTARETIIRQCREENPNFNEIETRGKLVAYSNEHANSCVEKDGMLASVPIRLLPTGNDLRLTGEALEEAVKKDLQLGNIPTICIATLGTTGTCAYDDIESLAPICKKYGIWLHVDAAYAGALLCLPEHREEVGKGLELIDSFNLNLDKTMLVTFESGALWLKDTQLLVDSFTIDRIYLQHKNHGNTTAPDYRNWQIPLGRRFRALKAWFTFRSYGAEGLRSHIRKYIKLAKYFENKVIKDDRFELVTESRYGLVCFRLKGDDTLTTLLLIRLLESKKMYVLKARNNQNEFIRFVVGGFDPQEKDIDFAWNEIVEQTKDVLKNVKSLRTPIINEVDEKFDKNKNENIIDTLFKDIRISDFEKELL